MSPNANCTSNKFSVELIFMPWVLDNVTNWKVFEGDEKILYFILCENTFKNMVIDEGDHDEAMNKETPGNDTSHSNVIAPFVVRMEHLYDLHDKFERVTNYKTSSSTMQYEMINLGSEKDPRNVNLGLGWTTTKRSTFIKLLK